MSLSPLFFRVALIIALSLGGIEAGWSQTSAPAPIYHAVSDQLLSAKIKEVEATTEIDETLQITLVESYRRSQSHLEAASANAEAADSFARQLEESPAHTAEIRAFLESVKDKPEAADTLNTDMPKAETEALLVREKANLAAVQAKLGITEEQLKTEKNRPTEARERLTSASTRINSIATALRTSAPEQEDPRLSEASQWSLESENLALQEEVKMLNQELLSREVRITLLKAERDRSSRSAGRIGSTIAALELINNEQRQQEADIAKAKAEAAKIETSGKHPLLQQLAEENDIISNQLQQVTAELEQVKADQSQANLAIKGLREEFKNTQLKLDIAGLSQALGQVLHEQRRLLPEVNSYQAATKQRERLIAGAGLKLLNQQEQRVRFRDSDGYAKELGAGLDLLIFTDIYPDLMGLFEQQAQLLDTSIRLEEDYIRALGELEFVQRKLVSLIINFREYLDQRLLWIRTASTPSLDTLTVIPQELKKFFINTGWIYSWEVLVSGLATSLSYVAGIFTVGLLLWRNKWLKARVDAINSTVATNKNTNISQTLKALAYVILRAAPWPLLFLVISFRLEQQSEGHLLTRALSDACRWAAIPLFYLTAFRMICRPQGLAAVHFHWPEPLVFEMNKALRQLALILIPVGFIAVLLLLYPPIGMSGTLGRVGLITLMASVTVFFLRLFGPKSSILPHLNPDSKLVRRQYLWFLLALIVPSLIFYLAFVGYAYTAGFLLGRLINSFLMVLVVTVLHQIFMRWLGLVQNKLPSMLDKIAITERGQASEQSSNMDTVDIELLTNNSRTLINTMVGVSAIVGLWLIWSEVLPALSILDKLTLWSYSELVDQQLTKVPVTLADLGLAILVATITIIATRSLPALLEIILIQLIRMPSGDRYTTLTLLRYIIVAGGFFWTMNIIGARWDQIQWLAAGLTVGIGFGLQEIVANFISGLIILFERPIRVGDKVTVGDTMGVVTKIRIRATTIQTWDRQELLVPNKEFITSRLLNWTLSDQTSRIVIKAEVVHGTNIKQAMALMLEASSEHAKILKDPKAFVTMDGFSDNALELNMRCYVGSFDDRLDATSSIYQTVNNKFKQAGIKIAFQQRDLHIDSNSPLHVKINPDDLHRD